MKNIYILILGLMISFVGCTDKFEDFNTDQKNPAEVAGNGLFTNAQKEMSDQVNETNVNQNNWRLWCQYWTETTYTDEANYDIVTRNVPQQVYRYFYRETLIDLKEAKKLIAEEEVAAALEVDKQNRLYIIDLMNAYVYQRLVDIFGMAIYSEALDIDNVYPKYDAGQDVYMDLIAKVNTAVAGLDASGGSFGSADLFYGGDVASWIKFGNTLKVKLGIHIADYDATTAETLIEGAVADGVFTSLDDDCELPYSSASPNQNPLHEQMVASGRDDFVPANTLVDAMKAINDPRMDAYFENMIGGEYLGGPYGYSSPFAQYSHVNSAITAPTFPGLILGFIELQFYLAEAAERGFDVGGTAESFYNAGITASFDFWGVSDVALYLALPEVNYLTATGDWRQKIGTQSWISNYPKGFVAWNTWRRLDYPQHNIAQQIEEYSEIPTRFTFPISEQTLNKDNYEVAAAAVGGDVLTTKVFWDVYDSPFAK